MQYYNNDIIMQVLIIIIIVININANIGKIRKNWNQKLVIDA